MSIEITKLFYKLTRSLWIVLFFIKTGKEIQIKTRRDKFMFVDFLFSASLDN